MILHPENHDVRPALLMPEHFGITIFRRDCCQTPIRAIRHLTLHKRPPMVDTVRHLLNIGLPLTPCGDASRNGIVVSDRPLWHVHLPVFRQKSAPGKNHAVRLWQKNGILLRPVEQIAACGVSPAHVSPFRVKRIVLEIVMVNAIFVNQSIRVVDPADFRRHMEGRTCFFSLDRSAGAKDARPECLWKLPLQ